jgi:hypothetical protein
MTDISLISAGHRYCLVAAAITKRILSEEGLKAGERLEWLEKLNGLTDQYITPEMLAAVEPASDVEAQIFSEAMSLPIADDHGNASFRVLTRDEVFSLFRSLHSAIELRKRGALS